MQEQLRQRLSWPLTTVPVLEPLLAHETGSDAGSSERWWRERAGGYYSGYCLEYLHMVRGT